MCGEWVFMCVCAGGRSSEEKEQVANRDPLCMQTRSFARARVHAHITLSCIIALHAKIIKNEMEIALILINRIARARSLAREDWIKKWKKKERKTIFQLLCAICFAIAIALIVLRLTFVFHTWFGTFFLQKSAPMECSRWRLPMELFDATSCKMHPKWSCLKHCRLCKEVFFMRFAHFTQRQQHSLPATATDAAAAVLFLLHQSPRHIQLLFYNK